MKTDDPKLTAYALDELDPTERAEIEALLKEDPALAAEIAATRELGAQLRSEFRADPADPGVPLTDAQREAVLAEAEAAQKTIPFPRTRQILKIAAAVVLVGGVSALVLRESIHNKPQMVPRLTTEPAAEPMPAPVPLTAKPAAGDAVDSLFVTDNSTNNFTITGTVLALDGSKDMPTSGGKGGKAPEVFPESLAQQDRNESAPNKPPINAPAQQLAPASPIVSEPQKRMEDEVVRRENVRRSPPVEVRRADIESKENPAKGDAAFVAGRTITPEAEARMKLKETADRLSEMKAELKQKTPVMDSDGAPASNPTDSVTKNLTDAPRATPAPAAAPAPVRVLPPASQPVVKAKPVLPAKPAPEAVAGATALSSAGTLSLNEQLSYRSFGGAQGSFGLGGVSDPAASASKDGLSIEYRIDYGAPIQQVDRYWSYNKPDARGRDKLGRGLQSVDGGVVANPASEETALLGDISTLSDGAKADAETAKKFYDSGDLKSASDAYVRILTREPENKYAWSNLGVVQFREGKLKEAEESLERAKKSGPDDASARVQLGIVLFSQSKYDEAITELTQGIALDPKSAVAHNYLGIVAGQKGWQEAAQKQLETAVALNPQYADAHFNLAVVLATKQPPDKAQAQVRYRLALSNGAERDTTLEGLLSYQQVPTQNNTESYDSVTDNAFLPVQEQPLSTFSIDVDTASYANVRRMLNAGQRPPRGAVRVEEMVNYFRYDYPQPVGDAPFSATMEVAACPWAVGHRLVRVGLQGKDIARSERPAVNLVFLIDVSGSMEPANKLPLVKESLRQLIDQLGPEDQVAMAVYAGASGTVLEPTRDKAKMRAALGRLNAGGSTNGASGIQLAYKLAEKSFIKGGTNRVILATDGDFNVGVTSQSDLVDLIEKKAKSGVFLTVLGFGMDNLKDSTLEKLADKGNGNYGYIDTALEAKKMLVEQMNGTLFTIAKDVKIQVEFNPAQVAAYRLIGYENRLMAKEDFNDDTKDAGEIGAGHSVTALYEIIPSGGVIPGIVPKVDDLRYSMVPGKKEDDKAAKPAAMPETVSKEMLTVKLRYKAPEGDTSKKLEFPLTDEGQTWEKSSKDFRWAAAVASYGMLLRDSPHKGTTTWNSVLELAHEGKGEDPSGYRVEFLGLIEKAREVTR